MTCTDSCPNLTYYKRRAHCSVCHRTFSGIRCFDIHRSTGKCLDPTRRNMTQRNDVWGYHGTFGEDRKFWDKDEVH